MCYVFSLLRYDNVSLVGDKRLSPVLVGEIVRKLAMFHAGRSFNHLVQDTKAEDHILVTSGE